ncbi:sulfite exporter TauE/SafE family protein [Brevibacillus sp. SYP-B805]|uniref:sulfite exporter TauE/SafE family protein n=1 Tax=Brevibacillus sp. SYP-B805 TaxID=1578199 RepID=UPI0013EBA13C|nr:sulfite exporter TauE/SafE family protein [Brevibacillus sp. SYP-B805]NGQ95280.1 sulfite exporter TauE/SafE family protein [Brevibacillus sp. SYP-B805]
MDWNLFIVMLILGGIGSFFSGLLGIGGAIIHYPLLLFIPSALGIARFTAQQVSAISMFQVFFSALAGVLAYRSHVRNGPALIHKGLVRCMGTSILLGSLIGGISSTYLSGEAIHLVYGVVAIVAVVLMLFPNKGTPQAAPHEMAFHKPTAAAAAFVVGVVSGIVGAGGAFALIPIMLTVLKISTRVAIASSLAIVFISAVGGVIGKIAAGHIPLMPTVFTVIGSLLGAPIGSRLSTKINVRVLRYGLVVVITASAIKIWLSVF